MIHQPGFASPKFINAGRLLADSVCDEEYQMVRVINNTANITNGKVLIRRFAGAPDGCYQIDLTGCLVPHSIEFGSKYPDVEMWKPNLERLKALSSLPNDLVFEMKNLCVRARMDNSAIIMDSSYMAVAKDRACRVNFGFGLPQEMFFNSLYLEIILIEMLQYPNVLLIKDKSVSKVINGSMSRANLKALANEVLDSSQKTK